MGVTTLTREQAEHLLARLCDGLDRSPDTLRPGQISELLDGLQELSFEAGKLAVSYVIKTWTSPRFPTSGVIHAAVRQVTHEGAPNAAAYSRSGARQQYDPEQVRRALEAHKRWEEMTSEEYMAEVERLLPKIQV